MRRLVLPADASPLRPALAFAMLVGASLLDLRSRRVPNWYWLPFAAFAGVFLVADLLDPRLGQLRLLDTAIAYGMAVVCAALFWLFWRLRLFGGADAKGLMVLSFLSPWPFVPGGLVLPSSLQALALGSLLVALSPIGLLAWNLTRGDLRLPAAFLGLRMPLERARNAQVWPMQDVVEGRLVWRFWQHVGTTASERLDRLEQAGHQVVWVTYKVPLLVPMTLGFGVAWWLGDPMGRLARLLAT